MLVNYSKPEKFKKLIDNIKSVNTLSELFASHRVKEVIEELDAAGEFLASKMRVKTNQVRKIFDKLKNIEAKLKMGKLNREELKSEVLMLKPALAYVVARQPRNLAPLADLLFPAIEKVQDEKDFYALVRFLEAIVAYHKFHGGKD